MVDWERYWQLDKEASESKSMDELDKEALDPKWFDEYYEGFDTEGNDYFNSFQDMVKLFAGKVNMSEPHMYGDERKQHDSR